MSLDVQDSNFLNDYQNQEAPVLNVPSVLSLSAMLAGLIFVSRRHV